MFPHFDVSMTFHIIFFMNLNSESNLSMIKPFSNSFKFLHFSISTNDVTHWKQKVALATS